MRSDIARVAGGSLGTASIRNASNHAANRSAFSLSGETEVVPSVTAVPLLGHTPGHTGYRISSGGDSLLIWGDIVHAIPLQLPNPGVTTSFDVDQPLAARTRKALLE